MIDVDDLSRFECSCVLTKLARTTFLSDCADSLIEFLGARRDRPYPRAMVRGPQGQMHARIEHYAPTVWSCKIGRDVVGYGYSAEQAIRAALAAHTG